mmetsp:Transcript_31951/g.58130  ORF Transcript_31951/g.58130 Transcript_31951/m.58130 type:complete len:88 (+) Transcript_31951:1240-1503(+)
MHHQVMRLSFSNKETEHSKGNFGSSPSIIERLPVTYSFASTISSEEHVYTAAPPTLLELCPRHYLRKSSFRNTVSTDSDFCYQGGNF